MTENHRPGCKRLPMNIKSSQKDEWKNLHSYITTSDTSRYLPTLAGAAKIDDTGVAE